MPKGFAEVTEAVVGQRLAKKLGLKLGDDFSIMTPQLYKAALSNIFHVTGIVATGDQTDDLVLVPLEYAQSLIGEPDAISRVEVSARTKPEDAFARVDPDTLSPAQKEIWYCRPYANSIAYQIREAIPSADAQQVRQVEQSEGTILSRISGFMWLISAAALLAAAFAVSAAMATAILERQSEIGLMRSLGAPRSTIALLFYSESALLALVTGSLGYLFGSALAAWLGVRIFAASTAQSAALTHLTASQVFIPVLLPVVVAVALIVAIAGSAPSIRAALKLDPSLILRADA